MANKKAAKILLLSTLTVFTFFFRVYFVVAAVESQNYIIEGEDAGFVSVPQGENQASLLGIKNLTQENEKLLLKIIEFVGVLTIILIIYLIIIRKKRKNASTSKE